MPDLLGFLWAFAVACATWAADVVLQVLKHAQGQLKRYVCQSVASLAVLRFSSRRQRVQPDIVSEVLGFQQGLDA